jgi:DNA polymerase-3 subunit alpha
MATVTLDDRTGRIDVTVFPELFEEVRHLLVPDAIIVVTGNLRPDNFTNGWTLTASAVRTLVEARRTLADHLALRLDLSEPAAHAQGAERVQALANELEAYRLDTGLPVRLEYHRPGAAVMYRLGATWQVDPTDALLKRLRQLFGEEAAEVIYRRASAGRSRTPVQMQRARAQSDPPPPAMADAPAAGVSDVAQSTCAEA